MQECKRVTDSTLALATQRMREENEERDPAEIGRDSQNQTGIGGGERQTEKGRG